MKEVQRLARRVTAWVAMTAVLLGAWMLGVAAPQTADAAVEAADKTYDIAVVYDNSGSMYQDGRMAWSQAKFAMEIFASMLDYDGGDRLTIYPMNKTVQVDPTGFDNKDNEWVNDPDFAQQNDPWIATADDRIEIKSVEDIDLITNMYSPYCGATPPNQIKNAKDDLNGSSADERWLIVLTDGVINGYKGKGDELKKMLKGYTTEDQTNQFGNVIKKGIKMQYLYFDVGDDADEANLKSDGNFFARSAKGGAELQEALISICNEIFQRDELVKFGKYYDSGKKTLKLDLSMKNLVVFAQGENINVTALKNSNGVTLLPTLNSGQRKYSLIATGRTKEVKDDKGNVTGTFDNLVADTSLAGQVVSFPACAAGNYTLEYTGDPKGLQIFYEPDVKLDIKLLNEDGVEVDASSGKLQAGDYTVSTKVVDSVTGQDVSTHPLMGGKVNITTTLSTADGDKQSFDGSQVVVTLTPDTETQIVVEAEYLEKYKISSEDMPDLPWPKGGFGVTEDIGFKVKVEHTQPDGEFKLNDMKNWKPLKVTLTLKDQPLTADQMKQVKLKVELSNGMTYLLEENAAESAFYVYLGKDEGGSFTAPAVGTESITVNATFPNNLGEEIPAAGKTDFTIKSIDYVIAAVVEQKDGWYALSDSGNWKPVRVDMTIDGRVLTDEELKMVVLTAITDPAMDVRTEMLPGESAFNVYIGQDRNGTFVAPETDDYILSLTATVTDEYGNSVKASAEAEYGVHPYSKLTQILMIVLPILILILLWLFYMTRKAFPKQIGKDDNGSEVKTLSSGKLSSAFVQRPGFQPRSKKLTVSTTNAVNYTEKCSVTLKLRPVDNHFTKSKDRRIQIVGIDSNCKFVTINGVEYTKIRNGVWARSDAVIMDGKAPPPIKQDVKNPTIEAVRHNDGIAEATLTCKLKNLK